MPIPSQYNLPPTINEDEFEDMVEDYFKLNYPNAQRYGRKGQKQYGLDITYTNNSSHQLIGIQCKKYATLSTSDIDSIIDAVGDFHIKINDNSSLEIINLIIATTAPRDAKIQSYVLQKRQELNKEIQIIFGKILDL
ncbi:restriction endonuclease [Terrisporobacter petrolearius]|uniref:restriction endonuclease n=1 Tax=Terrisporobacter petrolearius TaxID=1460447 RepID=UPI0031CC8A7D